MRHKNLSWRGQPGTLLDDARSPAGEPARRLLPTESKCRSFDSLRSLKDDIWMKLVMTA
jgi:hypothetical protein